MIFSIQSSYLILSSYKAAIIFNRKGAIYSSALASGFREIGERGKNGQGAGSMVVHVQSLGSREEMKEFREQKNV